MVESVIFTNMCMIRSGQKVLVIDRQNPDWPGITFPGGHVEQGESFTDSVIREVEEETGLNIDSPQICGIKDWYEDNRRHVVLLYKAARFEGELRSSPEGNVWWEDMDHLQSLHLAPDMGAMIRVFVEDGLSEFFYRKEGDSWVYDLK